MRPADRPNAAVAATAPPRAPRRRRAPSGPPRRPVLTERGSPWPARAVPRTGHDAAINRDCRAAMIVMNPAGYRFAGHGRLGVVMATWMTLALLPIPVSGHSREVQELNTVPTSAARNGRR